MANDINRISLVKKLVFGAGHVMNDLCASVWFSYLLVYLQYILQVSSGFSGIILLLGQIADAISTPLVGIFSDHGKCCCAALSCMCKYGKRKIWHLIGSLCILLSFPLMFAGCLDVCEHTNSAHYLTLLVILVCLFQFGWAAVQISHLAMIPELTPIESERDALNIIRFAFDIVSDMAVYGIAWFIFSGVGGSSMANQLTPANTNEFKYLALIVVGIGAIFTFIFHVGIHEVPKAELSDEETSNRISLQAQWLSWFKKWNFYRVIVLYTSSRLAHNLSAVFISLFLQENNQSAEMLATIPLVMNVAGLIGSALLKLLINYFGKAITYYLSSLCGLIGCICLAFVSTNPPIETAASPELTNQVFFYAVSALIGCSGSMVVILSLTSVADMIEDNTESAAFVYGCMSFWDKLGSGVIVALIQGLHSYVCEDGCTAFYREVLVYGVGAPLVMVMLTCYVPVKTYKILESHNTNNYGTCDCDCELQQRPSIKMS